MCENVITIKGYHGTDTNSANKILDTKYFRSSKKKNEWLGHGTYLYEELSKARWWASISSKRRNKESMVLECIAKVEKHKVFNFDVPEHANNLIEFIQFIEKESIMIFDENEDVARCQLLELYRKQRKQKVTIGTFQSTNTYGKKDLEKFGIIRTERQICVHDHECFDFEAFSKIEE